jgi:hypothetical protein
VVRVEPVGSKEHGEQEDNVDIRPQCLDQAEELRFPRGVFHDNNLGAIGTDDIPSVDEGPGKSGTNDGQDQESDIGAIADRDSLGSVDALAERNLGPVRLEWSRDVIVRLTKLPMTAPRLKIIQNHEM